MTKISQVYLYCQELVPKQLSTVCTEQAASPETLNWTWKKGDQWFCVNGSKWHNSRRCKLRTLIYQNCSSMWNTSSLWLGCTFREQKKKKRKKKVLELMKVILIFCRQPFLFFLPNPNMAKLTARQNTTELLIMTADSVNLIIRKQK